eukprot:5967541-Amphidinium_carterae.1
MSEFKLLPPAAVLDLAQFFKTVELTGVWPVSSYGKCSTCNSLRMRPGNGGPSRSYHRSIACGAQPANMMSKSGVKGAEPSRLRPGMPAASLQAGVFLDCSKCYERVPLAQLEQFTIERGFPLYALNCALN